MTTKIIFFDIDETLCLTRQLTADNLDVLTALQSRDDIKIAIATGRGPAMIPNEITSLINKGYFHAVITANGQFNCVDNTCLTEYPVCVEDTKRLIDVCRQINIPFQMLSEHHVAWSEEMSYFSVVDTNFPGVCVVDPDYYKSHKVYQFSIFLTEDEEHLHHEYAEAFERIGYRFTRWQGAGADLMPEGASKARGISDICNHFGIDISDTMAFGDGLNDIEMLEHVGVGVAMGNGWQKLKDSADFVTTNIEDNGIRHALKHYGIL